MYITKEELDARLKKTELHIEQRTRKSRSKEERLTQDERTLIGILDSVDTQKNIADLMGVSQTTVSNNSRGLVGVSTGVDKELRERVEAGKTEIAEERLEHEKKIQDQLITNLAAALGHVANNMSGTDASAASRIAVDMSKILDRVSSPGRESKGNRTAIIINVPSMKEEKHYQTIDV
jgi:predicted transcriptional regulator